VKLKIKIERLGALGLGFAINWDYKPMFQAIILCWAIDLDFDEKPTPTRGGGK
jgi:hypothetical protein